MDHGKRKVDESELSEAERRQLRARRNFAIAAEEFGPLLGQIDTWLAQHIAPQGKEEPDASDLEDSIPPTQNKGLKETLEDILQRLEGKDIQASGSRSNHAADPVPELPPVDPQPQVPPVNPKPEVASPVNPKPDAPLVERKPEASPP